MGMSDKSDKKEAGLSSSHRKALQDIFGGSQKNYFRK